jgi:glycosyltransferase involved in cell wall biosynthesis
MGCRRIEPGWSASLSALSSMPVAEMGERGRRWMAASFSWDKCALEMLALYKDLLVRMTF